MTFLGRHEWAYAPSRYHPNATSGTKAFIGLPDRGMSRRFLKGAWMTRVAASWKSLPQHGWCFTKTAPAWLAGSYTTEGRSLHIQGSFCLYISLGRDLLSLLSQKFLLHFTSLVSLLPPPERSVSNPEETARQRTLGPNWPVGRPPSEVSGLRLVLERVDFPHTSSYQGGYKPRKN